MLLSDHNMLHSIVMRRQARHSWPRFVTVRKLVRAGEAEEVAAMERDFLKSVLAVKKLEAEVRLAVQQVRQERFSRTAAVMPIGSPTNPH